MKLLRRILANFIDAGLFLAVLVAFFVFILPIFFNIEEMTETQGTLIAVAALVLVPLIVFAIQYPFLIVHQTVGKAFFGLKMISTNEHRPLTVSIIVQREVFAKVMTCYIMCIPVLIGRQGPHDKACETEVIIKRREPIKAA